MNLMDYKNEDAIDVLADLLEPASAILTDTEIQKAIEERANDLSMVKLIMKNHKKEIIEILAIIDGVPVEEYSCNVISLATKVLKLVNDKELVSFFMSQSQMKN